MHEIYWRALNIGAVHQGNTEVPATRYPKPPKSCDAGAGEVHGPGSLLLLLAPLVDHLLACEVFDDALLDLEVLVLVRRHVKVMSVITSQYHHRNRQPWHTHTHTQSLGRTRTPNVSQAALFVTCHLECRNPGTRDHLGQCHIRVLNAESRHGKSISSFVADVATLPRRLSMFGRDRTEDDSERAPAEE